MISHWTTGAVSFLCLSGNQRCLIIPPWLQHTISLRTQPRLPFSMSIEYPELDQAGNIPSRLRSAFSSSLTDALCLTSLITVPLWWQLPPIWLVPLLTSRRSINQHRFIQVRHMSTESKVSFCPYVWPKEAFSWMSDAFLTTFKTKIIQNQPLVCLCFVFLLIWVIIYLYSKAEIFGAPCSCLSRALNSYRG